MNAAVNVHDPVEHTEAILAAIKEQARLFVKRNSFLKSSQNRGLFGIL